MRAFAIMALLRPFATNRKMRPWRGLLKLLRAGILADTVNCPRVKGKVMHRRTMLHMIARSGVAISVGPQSGTAMGTAQRGAPVAVGCTGAGDAERHKTLCALLIEALSTQNPRQDFITAPAPAPLTLTLTLKTANTRALIGHLAWNGRHTGQEPEITSGIRGTEVNARQLDIRVHAILKASSIPLRDVTN